MRRFLAQSDDELQRLVHAGRLELPSNETFQVLVTDADNGVLSARWLVPGGDGEALYRMKSVALALRNLKGDDANCLGLFSVKASELHDDPAEQGYYWGSPSRVAMSF